MPRTRAIVCAMLAASMTTAAIGAGVAFAAAAAGSKSKPIVAQATPTNGFNPGKITVEPGAVVYFTNKDKAPHDAVSSKKIKGKPAFNSGSPTTGNFKATAPRTPGTYTYICTVHPFMKGTLVVKR